MIINIDVSDLIKDLDKDLKKIEEGIEKGMELVASEIHQMELNIIDESLNPNSTYVRSGKLKSSTEVEDLVWEGSVASQVITNTANYAVYNELATGIYAENGQGRQGGWYYPVGDGTYRFTLGMPPKRFVQDSYEFYKDKAPSIIQQSIFNKL